MKKTFMYCLVIAILMAVTASFSFAGSYYDLNGTAYQNYANELSERGIISGYPDGQFKPNNNITRAEFATTIAKMNGIANMSQYDSSFKDMDGYGWAKGYISYCANKGIMQGDGKGNAMPGQNITYGEAVTMVVRALGYENEVSSFGYAWPQNYINVATKYNLLNNVPSYLNNTALTRGDVSIMLYNSVNPSNTMIANNNINSNNNITINDNSVTDNSVNTNININVNESKINIDEPKTNSNAKTISALEEDKEKLQDYINECTLNKKKVQITLDQYEKKLEVAKANLEAVKQQKTVRVYHADKGWVWEVDQSAVKKCEEQVTYYEGYVGEYQILVEKWDNKISSAEKQIAKIEKQIAELKGDSGNNTPPVDNDDKPAKVTKGYAVINEKARDSNDDEDRVWSVIGYKDGQELNAQTDTRSSNLFNGWKSPNENGDNWYLYEIEVNSKGVIVSTDRIGADISLITVEEADGRRSIVSSDNRYILSSNVVIYQVTNNDEYKVHSGVPKTGDIVSLYEVNSSEDGYDIVIFSRP